MALMYFMITTTFTVGLMGLALHRKHLVSALLCLEAMLLVLFTSLGLSPEMTNCTNSTMQPIVLLTLAACGAGTGLSLLVATTRAHASDHMKNLNLLTC